VCYGNFDAPFFSYSTSGKCHDLEIGQNYNNVKIQEVQVILTNPRDALRGQSRSPNTVPCHVLGMVSSLRRAVFPIFDFKNAVTEHLT